MEKSFLQKLKQIKAFVFDVDGVLTDGSMLLMKDGDFVRSMNTKDGFAIQTAIKQGYKVAIISGKGSEGVKERLKRLGVHDAYLYCEDKIKVLHELIDTYQLKADEFLYMGDDVLDQPPMEAVGLPTCPRDAANDIIEIAEYVSPYEGGRGCVRDIIEKTLKIQEKWPSF